MPRAVSFFPPPHLFRREVILSPHEAIREGRVPHRAYKKAAFRSPSLLPFSAACVFNSIESGINFSCAASVSAFVIRGKPKQEATCGVYKIPMNLYAGNLKTSSAGTLSVFPHPSVRAVRVPFAMALPA